MQMMKSVGQDNLERIYNRDEVESENMSLF